MQKRDHGFHLERLQVTGWTSLFLWCRAAIDGHMVHFLTIPLLCLTCPHPFYPVSSHCSYIKFIPDVAFQDSVWPDPGLCLQTHIIPSSSRSAPPQVLELPVSSPWNIFPPSFKTTASLSPLWRYVLVFTFSSTPSISSHLLLCFLSSIYSYLLFPYLLTHLLICCLSHQAEYKL